MNILDPINHRDAALAFDTHFSIDESKPSLQQLETIISSFANIPYENISKVIRYREHFEDDNRIRLPSEVVDTHIRHRLGGTCFSLTFLLQSILTRHHFLCYPVMADMRWGRNVHCAMIVQLNSKQYLVDPGYLLTRPMEIDDNHPRMYRTSYSGVELVFNPKEGTFELSTFDETGTKWRYRFKNQPVPSSVFMKHWLSSFSWNSMHGLCLTRVEKERLVYIHKTFYRETTFSGKRNMNIKNRVHQTVENVFELGLWVPKEDRGIPG